MTVGVCVEYSLKRESDNALRQVPGYSVDASLKLISACFFLLSGYNPVLFLNPEENLW